MGGVLWLFASAEDCVFSCSGVGLLAPGLFLSLLLFVLELAFGLADLDLCRSLGSFSSGSFGFRSLSSSGLFGFRSLQDSSGLFVGVRFLLRLGRCDRVLKVNVGN